MGKVFTWQEITAGLVPKRKDFFTLAQMTRQRLSAESGVISAILCGSVIWGSPNSRSDLDCVVIYEEEQRLEVMKVLNDLYWEAQALCIEVEFIPLGKTIAASGMHHLQNTFIDHLNLAIQHGGLIGVTPMDYLKPTPDNEVEFRVYLRNKLRTLEKGMYHDFNPSDEGALKFLQKVLDAPIHLVRKYLRHLGNDLINDSKEEVAKNFEQIGTTLMRKQFAQLTKLDRQYSAAVDDFSSRRMELDSNDQKRYELELAMIYGVAPICLDFTTAMALQIENP